MKIPTAREKASARMIGKTAWNRGLTKETHPSIKKASEKISGENSTLLGKEPWNKGLTKATDERVQRGAEKMADTKRGGTKIIPWNKELTKETDPRVAKNAEGTSKTRQVLFAQGKLTTWNEGLTKETDERVAKSAETRAASFQEGKWKGWCKGLNKETDERVRRRTELSTATKRKQSRDGEITIWIKGLTKETDPRVAKLSKSQKAAYAEGRRKTSGGGSARKGFREDLGHFVRSSWEANFARLLKFLNRDYKYEPRRFVFVLSSGEETSYLPDFYIVDLNRFVEIKGFWREGHREKLRQFLSAHPEIELDVVGANEYALLEEKFSKLVPNWETVRR